MTSQFGQFAARTDKFAIPSNESLKTYRGMVQEIDVYVDEDVSNVIDFHSTNCWNKLIKHTHAPLSFACCRHGILDASILERAEMLSFRYTMRGKSKGTLRWAPE